MPVPAPLHAHARAVDGTIPVRALLYDDEDLAASQDNVGIYCGTEKAPEHQSGSAHTTSHRLLYVDRSRPATHSFALDLAQVVQTEHYAGLFTSSPKITLHLSPPPPSSSSSSFSAPPHRTSDAPSDNDDDGGGGRDAFAEFVSESWECAVCSFRNPPGASSASALCALCGVPRSSVPPSPSPSSAPPAHPSSSAPSLLLPSSSTTTSCPACTFLNHPALRACEICGTPLPPPPSRPTSTSSMRSALASRLATPPPPPSSSAQVKEETRSIKLSFRKGGDRAFYAALKRALTGKAWESTALSKPKPTGSQQPAAGIHGVLTTVSSSAHHTATGMTTALADLEALMAKAKDMVALAADLNDRLTALTSSSTTLSPSSSTTATANTTTTTIIEPEEATFIRSSLTQLGLQIPHAPVTLDMVQDERRWLDALARELAGVLQGSGGTAGGGTKEGRGGRGGRGGLMARRGVMGLDEAWGGWNRARGVALVPPSTFLQVLPHLPAHTRPPVRARKLGSRGVHILHVPEYAPAAFAARLVGLIALAGPRTAVEVAREEEGEGGEGGGGGGGGVPLGLVVEMVREVEEAGEVVRDEEEGRGGAAGGGGEVRWWVNEWRGYVWDGHVFDD